jgi:hypothetical protein
VAVATGVRLTEVGFVGLNPEQKTATLLAWGLCFVRELKRLQPEVRTIVTGEVRDLLVSMSEEDEHHAQERN